jgi:hypothetical protein
MKTINIPDGFHSDVKFFEPILFNLRLQKQGDFKN